MKLRTNISDLGLLRPLILTRGRLSTSTLVVTGIAVGGGLAAAVYILNHSTNVVLNLGLITIAMMCVIVASYLQAVLVGEFTFTGDWRMQVLLGESEAGSPSVKNHGAEFTIILILAMIANLGLIELGSGGFFDRYHNEGFFEVRLRSQDAEERFRALEDLRDPMNYELWERPRVKELILHHLEDEDTKTAETAVWLVGHLGILEGREQLLKMIQNHHPASAEALHSLGKLGIHDESRELLEEVASQSDDYRIPALRGLALMASPLSYDEVLKLVRHQNEDVRIHALWALRAIGDKAGRELIHVRLKTDPSERERCALLDALKFLATKDDINWARMNFADTPKNQKCTPLIWEERNEKQHYVTFSDTVRTKFVKIVANVDSKSHQDWFQRLVNDKQEEENIRQVANEVLKMLRGEN